MSDTFKKFFLFLGFIVDTVPWLSPPPKDVLILPIVPIVERLHQTNFIMTALFPDPSALDQVKLDYQMVDSDFK